MQRLGTRWAALSYAHRRSQLAPDHVQTLTPSFKAAWEARLLPVLGCGVHAA